MRRHLVSLGEGTPIKAVVADMDSVLTRMAGLHERAWQVAFNTFFASCSGDDNRRAELSHDEYRRYLDGKLRYQGAADLLAARHIDLPKGTVADEPGTRTVSGIGNHKEKVLIELLEREGVAVFADALDALRRWRLSGIKLAAISASCNCRTVLRIVELEKHLDVIVDGEQAREREFNSKQAMMLEAARQLGVQPADTLVLEDTAAGIRAGRKAGFGLTVGVNRNHHAAELENAGADAVVWSLSALRFPRCLPSALNTVDTILASHAAERAVAIFLDFDGTLAAIVEDPRKVTLDDPISSTLRTLSGLCTLGLISGRDRSDLQKRVGIEGILYAGSHGLDIGGPGYEKILPEAEAAVPEIERATQRLSQALESIHGVIIERKRFGVAVHYRQVRSDVDRQQIMRVVDSVLVDTGLRKRKGKQVVELEPEVNWDKGHALAWLLETAELDAEHVLVVYIGDDETDEDVFASLAGKGVSIVVDDEVSNSLADYRLANPDEVARFLHHLVDHCRAEQSAR